MKHIAAFALIPACLLMTACSQTDRQVIVKACVDDESGPEFCECVADKMEVTLSPELYGKIAEGIRQGAKRPEDVIKDLPLMEQAETLKMIPAMLGC